MADVDAQSIRYQVDKGEAAATGQEQEGHGEAQEVPQQQETVLLTGQKVGAEATSPPKMRGGVSWQLGQRQ